MKASIERITTSLQRRLAAQFVDQYHSYIKWSDRPSRKLYWSIILDGHLIGIWGLGSAFSKPKAVAKWMIENTIAFNELGNNIVYALAPHENRNLGSQTLALLRRDAVKWWAEKYGDELKGIQSFILPPRTGAMYKAEY